MNEFSASRVERRQSARTKLVEIAYIGMGPENGGLVLDVSEGGLSFHAVAPVERSQTLRFLLSLRGHSRVEGAGEVVWTNDTRTICGLRFTSLSSDAREHLNNWTNQSKMAASSPDFAGGDGPAPASRLRVTFPGEATETEAAGWEEVSSESAVSVASPPESESEPLFAIPPADQALWSTPSARQQSGAGLFVWVLFVLVGAAIVVAAFLYGVHVGQSQVMALVQRQVPSAPATAPGSAPTAASDVAPSSGKNLPDQSAGSASSEKNANTSAAPPAPSSASKAPDAGAKPEAPSATAPDERAGQETEGGKSQFAAAMADLNGTSGQQNTAKAVNELWSAVGNGSSDAEIVLAGLYADGFGVAKNCEQGRILLSAAARSGNPKAKPKLDELNARGCK